MSARLCASCGKHGGKDSIPFGYPQRADLKGKGGSVAHSAPGRAANRRFRLAKVLSETAGALGNLPGLIALWPAQTGEDRFCGKPQTVRTSKEPGVARAIRWTGHQTSSLSLIRRKTDGRGGMSQPAAACPCDARPPTG